MYLVRIKMSSQAGAGEVAADIGVVIDNTISFTVLITDHDPRGFSIKANGGIGQAVLGENTFNRAKTKNIICPDKRIFDAARRTEKIQA